MEIHHYHPITGEYIGTGEALPDPLEDSCFLIPAYATDVTPPKSGQNEIAVFDGESWSVKPDFRGTDCWSGYGDKHTITEIGETVPDGASQTEPEPEQPTSKQLAHDARAQRDARLSACDWVVIRTQELGQPVQQEWSEYRQALRDIPEQVGFPQSVDWPTEPESG